jgi:hypothetical protein
LPHSRKFETGHNIGYEALVNLAHRCRTSKSRADDPNGTFSAEFQTALFFKVVFEILQMQLAGQLGMAHFSQFSLRRQTKIHRNLIGGYLFID